MNKKLILATLILMISLTMIACGGEKSTETKTDEGKEITAGNEEAKPAEDKDKLFMEVVLEKDYSDLGIKSISRDREGNIIAYYAMDNEGEKGYLKLDPMGKEIERFQPTWLEDGQLFDFDKDNNMYVLNLKLGQVEAGAIDSSYRLMKGSFSKESFEETTFSFEVAGSLNEVQEDLFADFEVGLNDKFYFLKAGGSVEIYNESLTIDNIYDAEEVRLLEIDEKGNLYFVTMNQEEGTVTTKLWHVDPNTQEVISEMSFEDKFWINGLDYNKDLNKIYLSCEGTIYAYDLALTEEKIHLDMNILSEFQYSYGVTSLDTENMTVMLFRNEKMDLVYYGEADESAKASLSSDVEKKKVTVQVMVDINGIFKKAATSFEKEHPEIDVEIVEFGTLESKEYQEKLNLKLMAGEGADIFLDNFPLVTYAQKGYLMNLDEMINNDSEFTLEGLNEKVIQASKIDDTLFAFPIRYYYYVNIINQNVVNEMGLEISNNWNLDDVEKVMDRFDSYDGDMYMFDSNFKDGLLQSFLIDIDHYIDYEKKTADFNTDEFKRALTLTKRLKTGSYASEDIDLYKVFSGQGDDSKEKVLILPMYLATYAINAPFELFTDSFQVWKSPSDKGYRMAASNMAINSNSKNPQEAWEFIKYMTTYKAQETTEIGGLSINNEYRLALVDIINKRIEGIKPTFPDAKDITEDEVATLEAFNDDIGNNSLLEGTLRESIVTEMDLYFEDSKSLEETVETIQNKVDIYLNE